MEIEQESGLGPNPLGAIVLAGAGTHFRVWAPSAREVSVQLPLRDQSWPLKRLNTGYHCLTVPGVGHGDRYQFSVDGGPGRPDPASRSQPDGVHAASQVIDLGRFKWSDSGWPGVARRDLVIYELHLGSFTQAGTCLAAIERLDSLERLGITAVELMPLAQSPGRWNWGYDGVNLFAPSNNYGTPEELSQFIDACHSRGLAVILDVVYNHLGPEGNYLREFAPYFSDKYPTPWGEALDFESEMGQNVRHFILQNVRYWMQDYHFDGLRLDAIHFLFDDSPRHILQDIRSVVTELEGMSGRELHLIGEANVFDGDLLAGTEEDYDATWCDCLMHSIYAQAKPGLQLTNRKYFGEHEMSEVLEHGYLYWVEEGRPARATAMQRESALHPPRVYEQFIVGLQTHDSVGNHPQGRRLHQLTSTVYQRAAAALSLLSVGIPQIFMGEEAAYDGPFPFFVDFGDPHLKEAVERGRAAEYPDQQDTMLPPTAESTFQVSKYTDETKCDKAMLAWYRQVLQVRRAAISVDLLTRANMQVESDLEHSVFTVRYEHAGEYLQVTCRLEREHAIPNAASDSPGEVGSTVILNHKGLPELLFSSLPCSAPVTEQFDLQPVHAVVSASSAVAAGFHELED